MYYPPKNYSTVFIGIIRIKRETYVITRRISARERADVSLFFRLISMIFFNKYDRYRWIRIFKEYFE